MLIPGASMRQEIIAKSLMRRVSLPANLLMVGLLGGMFCLFDLVTRGPGTGLARPSCRSSCWPATSPWRRCPGSGPATTRTGRGWAAASCRRSASTWPGSAWCCSVCICLAGKPGPRIRRRSIPGRSSPAAPAFHGRLFGPAAGLGLVNLGFGIAYGWVCRPREATEAASLRTAALLRQARARALQNQLEPHVLYNALNGIAELVHEDPLAAEEAIASLADLYRMLTAHGEAALVLLEQERRLVEAYLAMEQMRLGERLRVALEVAGRGRRAAPAAAVPAAPGGERHQARHRAAGGGRRGGDLLRQGRGLGPAGGGEHRAPLQGAVRGVGWATWKPGWPSGRNSPAASCWSTRPMDRGDCQWRTEEP